MRNIRDNTLELLLIGLIILMLGIGLGFLYTASQPVSMRYYGVSYAIVLKQAVYMGIGLFLMIFAAVFNHSVYRKMVKTIVFFTIILLILTLIPGLTREAMGARRWINIFGVSIQPSEIAKLTIVIYLSSVLSNKGEYIQDFYKGIFPPICVLGIFLMLILAGNDFSTTFLIIILAFVIFFLAGIRILTLSMLFLVGMAASFIMILFAPYRMKRLFAFIDPWADPLGSGWQYIQAMKCFSLGGYFGVGLGESTQKNMALPEAHNDYIFAIIAEEGGALTAIFLVLIFLGVAVVGLNIAKKIDNKYSFLLACGIVVTIFIQGVINMAVVVGFLPATGITLPFISSGGTSIVVFMYMVGILINISLKNKLE